MGEGGKASGVNGAVTKEEARVVRRSRRMVWRGNGARTRSAFDLHSEGMARTRYAELNAHSSSIPMRA